MIHYAKTTTTKQLYNLLVSIYTAPNDYLCVSSHGIFIGWLYRSAFTKEGFGAVEVERLVKLAKAIETSRRLQIFSESLG